MDLARIRREVAEAQNHFALVELRPTDDGNVFVKTAIQTAAGLYYVLSIKFPDTYPNEMPRVFIDAPGIEAASPHRYPQGNICYMHPSMWNPGSHSVKFVVWRAAKWLNKYDVWRVKRKWPGVEIKH